LTDNKKNVELIRHLYEVAFAVKFGWNSYPRYRSLSILHSNGYLILSYLITFFYDMTISCFCALVCQCHLMIEITSSPCDQTTSRIHAHDKIGIVLFNYINVR